MVKTFDVPEKLEQLIAKRFPFAPRGVLCCGKTAGNLNRYACTRPMGHSGPHVAHTSDTTAAFAWIEEDNDG